MDPQTLQLRIQVWGAWQPGGAGLRGCSQRARDASLRGTRGAARVLFGTLQGQKMGAMGFYKGTVGMKEYTIITGDTRVP